MPLRQNSFFAICSLSLWLNTVWTRENFTPVIFLDTQEAWYSETLVQLIFRFHSPRAVSKGWQLSLVPPNPLYNINIQYSGAGELLSIQGQLWRSIEMQNEILSQKAKNKEAEAGIAPVILALRAPPQAWVNLCYKGSFKSAWATEYHLFNTPTQNSKKTKQTYNVNN